MAYTFQGFSRTDGSAGTRNHVGIIPSVICSSEAARAISEQISRAVAITHVNGCAQLGDDFHVTRDILTGVAENPNVYASLFVGLGCEHNQVQGMLEKAPETKQTEGMTIQEQGGHNNTVGEGLKTAGRWAAEAGAQKRQELPLSSLTIGVLTVEPEDASLRQTAPLMGKVVDHLLENHVNIITGLSKTLEPAGSFLAARTDNTEMKKNLALLSEGFSRNSWGNVEGNSTETVPWTTEEITRAEMETAITGTKNITSLLNYGEASSQQGLHLMRVPSNIVEALAGMAAAECAAAVIVSSRGIFTGSSILPCVTAAPDEDFTDLVDFVVNAESEEHQISRFMEKLLRVCSGEKTSVEELELGEFSISHTGTTF
ncbi:UxaA family hydrolase [Salibacterium aidingense]|uniref:UxaA family hydrolase n=1 Tax=Salibacterium aidingense TaxID=384933 RepID=UPI003BD639B4